MIAETIWFDNRKWLYRDPDLLDSKFQTMSDSIYNFMRGTQRLHWIDSNRPTQQSSSFLRHQESSHVLIYGDPHPENWGIKHAENGLISFEMMDLDAAEYGPWIFDLRRLCLGMIVIANQLENCDCAQLLTEQIGRGYMDGLSEEHFVESLIMSDLVEEAYEESRERKKFFALTTEENGTRRFLYSLGYIPPIAIQWAQLQNVRILDVMTKNMGVSSYSALRYMVLWDEGEEGSHDDRISQFRELSDSVVYTSKSFQNHQERLEIAQENLWLSAPTEWGHSILYAQGLYWKSFFYESSIQNFESQKIIEAWQQNDISRDDISSWARLLGETLAQRHAKSITRNGWDARIVITEDIVQGGGEKTLLDELQKNIQDDWEQIHIDYSLFQDLHADNIWNLR